MNTEPENELRNLWLEDELAGEELAAAEQQFGNDSKNLAEREEVRKWKQWLGRNLSASEEPAAPEIFNARLLKQIEQKDVTSPPATPVARKRTSMMAWFVPAAAGMAIGFFLGAQKEQAPQVADVDVTGAPKAIPVELTVYTPEQGVEANWFKSSGADAYVIVLDGVPAIPDEVDFTKRISWSDLDSDSVMADLQNVDFPAEGGSGS